MIYMGMDPGVLGVRDRGPKSKAKPSTWVRLDGNDWTATTCDLPHGEVWLPGGPAIFVAEQADFRAHVNPRDILDLVHTAAWTVGAMIPVCRVSTLISVVAWKDWIQRGGARVKKSVFVQRLRDDHNVSEHWSDDAVEALGLALYAAGVLGGKGRPVLDFRM